MQLHRLLCIRMSSIRVKQDFDDICQAQAVSRFKLPLLNTVQYGAKNVKKISG